MKERGHISAARLSAYHDGELAQADIADVRAHVAECTACRSRLRDIERLERMTSALPEPEPNHDLWSGIEASIGPLRRGQLAAELFGSPARRFAAAAVLVALLIAGLATFVLQNGDAPDRAVFSHADEEHPSHVAAHFGFDYGVFLTGLNEPEKMEDFDRVYQRREISIEEALSAADVPVDLVERIPEGLILQAVYVLSNEAARAVQVTYHHNGDEIAVFKQPEGLPVRFAGYRIEPAAIGTKQCLMVDTGRYCAITFSSNDAQYVVVGRNDDMQVAQIIDGLLASL